MAGRTAFFLVAALAFGRASIDAQSPSLPIPVRVETLVSAKVGEPREFWVSLPDRYNASTERYPVLYMMDGDFNFNSGVIGGVRQAASLGEIPEFIIVGIRNTNRSKDIFPEEITYPDGSKDGGRADQYLDFVRDELIPRVAKTYRTTDYRILYGTSNTGFTAVHALFRTPDLANAYVAASATLGVPSFRAGRDNLVGSFKGGRRELVLVMGEHDLPTVVSLNGALKETISTQAPAGLTCRLRVIENGEHVPPDALVEGLRVLFQGWKITRPLTESSFAEIRAQVDGRLEKFGVPGRIDEEALKGLGDSLLGEKKFARALEVLEYRATSYPQSADAQVGLGDGYRQTGNLDKARACYKRALALAPGHAAATAKLKEVGPPKGAYFGQALPGDTPVPFAPEILTAISAWVAGTAFSPDGTQVFVSVGASDYSGARLYYSTRVNDEWTPVVAAPFVSDFIYSNEPVFSAAGKTLTFTGRKSTGTQDLWTVGYADQRWGTPVALPSPINSDAKEFRGSYMSDGTMYFTSARSGMYQVYRAHKNATRTLVVELVGAPISTISYEGDPCIAPDGRFLIFNSARDGKSADLFVSFPDARGGWGTPINLGPAFNSPYDEYGAHLSSDGKYLFFTRHTPQGNRIYWVAVSAIEKLGRSQEKFAGYIDQAPPEQTPRVFRLQTHEGYFAGDRIAISADGKELYYTEVTNTWGDYNIRYYKYSDQKWNGPFDLFPGFLGPALSVDNKTMFFEKYNDSRTCWHSTRVGTGWSTPTLCTELPEPKDTHYLQDTASGRIYASSRGALNGLGQMDISAYVKTDAKGAFHSLGRPLNSPGNEGDFYVARDEAFIVFGSPHRGGFGGGDLFISFRERDGSWSDPKNLGATINTPGYEFGPYVTDDKRYLFYSSSSDFTRVDIHWIRFDSLLETLRKGTKPSDLPEHTYVIQGKPSEVVQNHDAVLALARQEVARPVIGTVKSPPKGAYFGQTLPGDTPVLFAPEILTSMNAWVEATAFSPDGAQFFVSVGAADYSSARLYSSIFVNDEWTPLVEAPFVSGFTYSNEPVFSADGKTLMFTGKKPTGSLDLWTVEYVGHRWGTPVALPSPINSDAVEYRGSYMSDGTLYFTSGRSGMNQVYKARKNAGQGLVVELVTAPISTSSPEGDPCIAPDGRFLIFNSARDWKSSDLYVSFRDARGGWGAPINLGPEFNSPDDEYGAHLSSDGKYLFFTRHTSQGNQIYWVAVSAIEKLRPR